MEPRLVTRWEAARWAREAYDIGARCDALHSQTDALDSQTDDLDSQTDALDSQTDDLDLYHDKKHHSNRVLGGCCGFEPYHIR